MAETNKIPTHPQRIRVFLRGGILAEGDAHVKAGAYQQRASDLLNLQSAPFLALTNVNYQAPGSSPMHTEAFLVRIPDIVAVDLFGTTDDGSAVPEHARDHQPEDLSEDEPDDEPDDASDEPSSQAD